LCFQFELSTSMPAPDLQHQRLRHLFASAILELWKKETGSVTSVLIEGTVCVTVHGGRTTVVQLCDRFAGLVNGADCERPVDVGVGGVLRHSDGHLYVAPATPTKSRGRAPPPMTTTTQSKDSNNNVRTAPRDVAGEVDQLATGSSVESDDDECSLVGDDDAASMVVDDDEAAGARSDSISGQAGSGTGSFSRDTKSGVDESADDSAIYDMSMNRTDNSLPDEVRSPRRSTSKTPAATSNGSGGNDLLLSSPHDYTAQVRNVIRQRLLNAGSKQLPPALSSR